MICPCRPNAGPARVAGSGEVDPRLPDGVGDHAGGAVGPPAQAADALGMAEQQDG
jgi:hypothetical protein